MTRAHEGLRVYNTLTRQIEPFQPIHGNRVNLFVCGPTVYDFPHLGNGKTYTQFDFIVRYLRFRGYDVFYLQNITDVDDKIIDRARVRGVSWEALAREFEQVYRDDMAALHNTGVDQYARATDYIPAIVEQVKTLLEQGYAYRTSDGIYFEIARFAEYGKLSGRRELRAEDSLSRIDESGAKRAWNDFCLWKAPKPGEPVWETEIGPGRPGWHIEDTAITESHFGPQYDVHGGAVDLIFPHHEAEIAQMEAASGQAPLVRYWLHTGFLNINAQKMSKSLGNMPTIRGTLERYDYRVLRFFFLSAHYRSPLDFSEGALEQAKSGLRRIDEFLFNVDPTRDDEDETGAVAQVRAEVYRELDDDFNTPRALAAVFEFIRNRNTQGQAGQATYQLFQELNRLFDFMQFDRDKGADEIAALIAEREQYRARKEFAQADAVRDRLQGLGIQVYDTKDGVKWRRVDS
jgi:cysteinyl-tRNA synthetase